MNDREIPIPWWGQVVFALVIIGGILASIDMLK